MNSVRYSSSGIVAFIILIAACSSSVDETVHAHLSGDLNVSGQPDTTDFSSFEILVFSEEGDTLAFATTDPSGHFATDVRAPGRGIYRLTVSRYGQLMAQSEYLIAEGDSSTFRLSVPSANRPIVIRSLENSAWAAYRNAKAAHSAVILELANQQALTGAAFDNAVMSTAETMWSIRSIFPETMGAELAASESILMLDSRADSVLIERARIITPSMIGYLNVVRAARRAVSRTNGVNAAATYIRERLAEVDDETAEATLRAELVQVYQDSSRHDDALGEAKTMLSRLKGTELADWAESLIYELEVLRPGFDTPNFSVVTLDQDTLATSDVAGETTILEFFDPVDESFRVDLQQRDSLISLAVQKGIRYVAISTNPDSDINEAFFASESEGELRAVSATSAGLVETFNIQSATRRILLSDSKIIGKYDGRAVGALYTDLIYGNFSN